MESFVKKSKENKEVFIFAGLIASALALKQFFYTKKQQQGREIICGGIELGAWQILSITKAPR